MSRRYCWRFAPSRREFSFLHMCYIEAGRESVLTLRHDPDHSDVGASFMAIENIPRVLCECGCGELAKKRFAHGHNRRGLLEPYLPYRTPTERFWAKVDKYGPVHPVLGTACWLWLGATSVGYGTFTIHTQPTRLVGSTHRFSWEIANGLIPNGLFVLHRCDVRHCVNPNHLFLGTAGDNARDMARKGRHWRQRGLS